MEESRIHLSYKNPLISGPVVKTLPSNAGGASSIPGQGDKIPHALWPKNQNIKQKQYLRSSIKTFKNSLHLKKSLKLKKEAPYQITYSLLSPGIYMLVFTAVNCKCFQVHSPEDSLSCCLLWGFYIMSWSLTHLWWPLGTLKKTLSNHWFLVVPSKAWVVPYWNMNGQEGCFL